MNNKINIFVKIFRYLYDIFTIDFSFFVTSILRKFARLIIPTSLLLFFLNPPYVFIRFIPNRVLVFIFKKIRYTWALGVSMDVNIHDSLVKCQNRFKANRIFIPQKEKHSLNSNEKIKLGIITSFSCCYSFPKSLIKKCPKNIDLYIYDIPHNDNLSPGYSDGSTYRSFANYTKYDDPKDLLEYANIISNDNLDALVLIDQAIDLYKFVDLLDTPDIVVVNAGTFQLPNSKCRVQALPSTGYPFWIIDHNIVNLKTGRSLKDYYLFTDIFYYSKRDIEPLKLESIDFSNRKNQIVFIGNLIKLNSDLYIQAIVELLYNNPDYIFIYYGKSDSARNQIERKFKNYGIDSRTFFKGEYSVIRDKDGNYQKTEEWDKAKKDISESRLFMQSFPICGGSSLVENYLLGVPCVNFYPDKDYVLQNKDYCNLNIQMLITESNNCNTINEYREKCQRIISDDEYANKIVIEQYNYASKKLCNEEYYWRRILEMVHYSNSLG
ncbi:MAG: hypothetical protein ACYTFY_02535 [Planctomycetota bacterium]